MTSASPESFEIRRPHFDSKARSVIFYYILGDKTFAERLEFGAEPKNTEQAEAASNDVVLRQLLDLTACILGTSYYKLKAPMTILAPDMELSDAQMALVKDVYENGLGEFYARNGLNRFGKLDFQFSIIPTVPSKIDPPDADKKNLLLIGGGKDSLVSVQLLQQAGVDFTPFAVNAKGPIVSSMERIGGPPLLVKRTLDPEMIRLGKQPEYFNGHVPSTAINSMIAATAAALNGYQNIILSNERSASEGNLVHDGRDVNHQHSKSWAFERLMASALKEIGAFTYFSLLRPYSETRIAQLFSSTARFDDIFSSCNLNFRLDGHAGDLWCQNCPKCRFVFLILAPFMTKGRLSGIFGSNMLNSAAQLEGFRHLSGLSGQKPWECVGEILEAAACLWHLTTDVEWQDQYCVQVLHAELLNQYGADKLLATWDTLMADEQLHAVPSEFAFDI